MTKLDFKEVTMQGGLFLINKTEKKSSAKYFGTVYSDEKHPITPYEVYLQQTLKETEFLPGDFIVIEDQNTRFFANITQIEEAPLYVKNPDAMIFLARQLSTENIELSELAKLPQTRKETKIVLKAKIHKVERNGEIFGPGIRPSPIAVFREMYSSEIINLLSVPTYGFPFFLMRSNGEIYRDRNGNPAVIRLDPKATLTGMLVIGSPNAGKTMFNGAFAWWYSNFGWSALLINNKADDLLYLDRAAEYDDPLWKELGWEPKGVPSFQIIYPSTDGCSRSSGPLIPFTFDTDHLQPKALTALIDFSERGVIHLPILFRHWKETRGGTIFDFINYLQSGRRVGTYYIFHVNIHGRPMEIRVHTATVDSAVSILQSYSPYFDGAGIMPSVQKLIKKGLVTVFDLSRADPIICKLLIQHYLHEIRSYQRTLLTEQKELIPLLFEVDEAHQFFKRYSVNEISRAVETEIETHIKLSRSLKIATVLSSQLGSELHPAANRLSTVKLLLKSNRSELKALNIQLTNSELSVIEAFNPGMAQLRDNFRIKIPQFVRIPMSPAMVKGQI